MSTLDDLAAELGLSPGAITAALQGIGDTSEALEEHSVQVRPDGTVLAAENAALVTSLPANPIDGQEILYVADATNGVVWHFRYRAGSASAFKWELLGGGDLFAQVLTFETTASVAYVDLATVGPSITVPFAGDYAVTVRTTGHVTAVVAGVPTAGIMSYSVGGSVPSDDDGATWGAAAVNDQADGYNQQVKTGVAANAAIVGKYRMTGNNTGGWNRRHLYVHPIRVG